MRGSAEAVTHDLTELQQGSAARLAVTIMALPPTLLTSPVIAPKRTYPLLLVGSPCMPVIICWGWCANGR